MHMKIKLTAALLALTACHLAISAQVNPGQEIPFTEDAPVSVPGKSTAVPPPSAPQAVPQATPQEVTEPATTPSDLLTVSAAEAAAKSAEGVVNEEVPLIVIDDVPLTDAIRNLARQSGLNFQFDPRITATNQPNVSIRFENVTPQEALEAVLENHNLQLEKDVRKRIGRISFRDPAAAEPLISKIIQLKYSDPTNMTILVKSTLSARSQVMADPRTGQLIVTTTEKEMHSVTNLLATLDLPTRQVLIESRIVETAHAPSTLKGINWSGTVEAQGFEVGNNAFLGAAPFGSVLSFPRVVANSENGFDPDIAFLNADGVSAVFHFFNKDNDSEVLSTPRAVTLDNQPALLSITRAFPIFQITPGSANSPAGASVTYTNLGTILNVTPRIAADNNISLRVIPEVSNIDGKDQQTLNGEENIANIYAIRRMEANVMIPSGNTLVMGGLVADTHTQAHTKVPIFGDIPGLGWFFRTKGKTRNKANLIIFVTPTIIDDTDFYASEEGKQFLKTRHTPAEDDMETAWDSAKPHDWTKPKK